MEASALCSTTDDAPAASSSDAAPAPAPDDTLVTSLSAKIRSIKLERPQLKVKEIVEAVGHEDGALVKKLVGKVTKAMAKEGTLVTPAAVAAPAAPPAAPPVDVCDPEEMKLQCAKCMNHMAKAVGTCSLCQRAHALKICKADEIALYCSHKCKRSHMPEHRQWHIKRATDIEHELEAMINKRNEANEIMLGKVKDDYDLGNIAALQMAGSFPAEAVKKLKGLIKDRPWEPEAYFNLGTSSPPYRPWLPSLPPVGAGGVL